MRWVVTAALNQGEQQTVEGKRIKCHPAAGDEIKRRERKTHTEGGRTGRKRKKKQSQEGKTSGDRESVGGREIGASNGGLGKEREGKAGNE